MANDGFFEDGTLPSSEDGVEGSEPALTDGSSVQQRKSTHREDSVRIRNHLLRRPTSGYPDGNSPTSAEPLRSLDHFSDDELGVLAAHGRSQANPNEERDTPPNLFINEDIEKKWDLEKCGQLKMVFEMDLSDGNVAAVLATARKEAGMTKVAVAEAMGVNEKTVRKIESGEQDPTSEMVGKYAKALGLVPVLGLASAG